MRRTLPHIMQFDKYSWHWGVSLLLLLLTIQPLTAQSSRENYSKSDIEARVYDLETWEQLEEDLDYSGKPPTKRKPRSSSSSSSSPTSPSRDYSMGEGWSTFSKIILITLGAILLAFVIYSFLQQTDNKLPAEEEEGTKDSVGVIDFERLTAALDHTDIDPYIQAAEEQQSYELAIRLHYLAVLKQLNEQGWIRWQRDATNKAYLQQLYGRPAFDEFRALTYLYEQTWFGHYRPTAMDYQKVKQRFGTFAQQITPLTTA